MVNTSGIISTFAGDTARGFSGDGGAATDAELNYPWGLAIDALGNVYIGDELNNRVRIVSPSGIINTFAGGGTSGLGDGGPATSAEVGGPTGITLDATGNLYIAAWFDIRVREVTISTGINNIPMSPKEISIYPSPTNGIFTVSRVTTGQIIEIYNYLGEKITTTALNNSTMQFDISDKANGIYFIKIQNKDGGVIITKKVLKTE